MLQAKKIGHAFYAFQRKKEFFENLYKVNKNNEKYMNHEENVQFIEQLLQTPRLCQDKNVFSKILHLLSQMK